MHEIVEACAVDVPDDGFGGGGDFDRHGVVLGIEEDWCQEAWAGNVLDDDFAALVAAHAHLDGAFGDGHQGMIGVAQTHDEGAGGIFLAFMGMAEQMLQVGVVTLLKQR